MASNIRNVLNTVNEIVQSDEFEQFRLNAQDFLSARESGESAGTQISQMTASIGEAAEILNRSFTRQEKEGQMTNVISPVVIPKDGRSYFWIFTTGIFLIFGLAGIFATGFVNDLLGLDVAWWVLFGPHYWLILLGFAGVSAYKNSFVRIPDGCQALITRFGKVEATVPAGKARSSAPCNKPRPGSST